MTKKRREPVIKRMNKPLVWGFIFISYYIFIMIGSFLMLTLTLLGYVDPWLISITENEKLPFETFEAMESKYHFLVLLAGFMGTSITCTVITYRQYRKPMTMQNVKESVLTNISKPIVGGLLAAMTFFVLKAGFLGVEVQSSVNGYVGFGFLIGLSTNQVMQKLYDIIETVFSVKKGNPQAKEKNDFK